MNILKRTLLVFSGIFAAFLVIELILRLTIFLYTGPLLERAAPENNSGNIRVLCIGESTTYKQYTYHLEKILNQRSKQHFKVIDKGLPGAGSEYFAKNIDEICRETKPDIAVIMLGINDSIEDINYRSFFNHIKIVRFLHFFFRFSFPKEQKNPPEPHENNGVVSHKFNRALLFAVHNDLKNSDNVIKDILSFKDLGVADYLNIMSLYKDFHEDQEKAEAVYDLMLRNLSLKSREDYRAYLDFLLLKNNYSAFIDISEQAIKKYPYFFDFYKLLATYYLLNGNHEAANKVLKEYSGNSHLEQSQYLGLLAAEKYGKGSAEDISKIKDALYKFRKNHYNLITKKNYAIVILTLQKYNCKVICMQYPMRRLELLKDLLDNRKDVEYIDNYKIFFDKLVTGRPEELFRDLFAGDFGHLSDKGNQLLAENLADGILRFAEKAGKES